MALILKKPAAATKPAAKTTTAKPAGKTAAKPAGKPAGKPAAAASTGKAGRPKGPRPKMEIQAKDTALIEKCFESMETEFTKVQEQIATMLEKNSKTACKDGRKALQALITQGRETRAVMQEAIKNMKPVKE